MAKGSWNDTTDKQLLLAVIHLTGPSTPKWDQVAAMMGEGFTSESVRQHFQKLKKTSAKEPGNGATSTVASDTAPKTPAKRTPGKKAAGETPAKSGSKRKASKPTSEVDGDDDESPTKKFKEEKSDQSDLLE